MKSNLQLSSKELNVLGTPLQTCSCNPLTGWFRDGFCHFDKNDHGNHTMCCIMDNNFLNYSKSQGNDLITSMPQYSFPGLQEGTVNLKNFFSFLLLKPRSVKIFIIFFSEILNPTIL